MTFRTFDIDAGNATTNTDATYAVARNVRSRRHAAILSRRSTGSRISGFGF